MRRVVITGMGTINPLGNNVEEYFAALKEGKNGAAPITRFDASKFKTQFACEVKDFNPTDHFDRKEARKLDRFAQFALVSAEQAIQNSGLDLEKIDLDKAGVIWASGIGGLDAISEAITDFVKGDGTPRFNPFFIPKMIIDIAAGHISIKYGFRGPNYGTVSACASANHAIVDSLNLIRWGKADIIITGGSEAAISAAGVGGFNAMQALSTRNDDPKTASRPFDSGRDGFVMGEGAGALVLEEFEHAKARGAKIYAEVVGGGMSADAYHLTSPHPNGMGACKSMQNAITDARLNPSDIEYVNTHGTSTPAGDVPEITGIMTCFGKHAYKLNISSTKSMTGHLLGAAAAVEAIATVMVLNDGIIPPTINNFELDKSIDHKLNLTLNKPQKREVKYALSNTFGFGGHNSSVIFKKYEE
ncbi:MAG: beta-ketoacyl-ACP synthase II [Rikenellaceae bacterium]